MTTSSAPGKVYLFGEHAVVYGEPAVLCAIERRARVTVEERTDGRLRVGAEDLSIDGFSVEYGTGEDDAPELEVASEQVKAGLAYVETAIGQAREAADAPAAGFDVTVESDIPLGAGIGSSAAVVVATIDAATRELGVELDPATIAERAYEVERTVQDGEASRADTFCSAMGGAVRVEGDDCEALGAPELPIVVGYDGGSGDTGELVAGVRALRERYDFAADSVAAIGDLVRSGERALPGSEAPSDDPGDAEVETAFAELGELMDVNHGLLSALGVSARSLDAMVWAARDAGALGAKLTGAGGGGCVVALADDDAAADDVRTGLAHAPDCETAFHAPVAETGVRRE